jgi:hypothetical protein
LGDLSIDEKITLKKISEKYGMKLRNASVGSEWGPIAGFFYRGDELCGFIKAQNLLTS